MGQIMNALKTFLCSVIFAQSMQAMEMTPCCLGAFAVTGATAYLLGFYQSTQNKLILEKEVNESFQQGITQGGTSMFKLHEEKIMNYNELKIENDRLQKRLASMPPPVSYSNRLEISDHFSITSQRFNEKK